MATFGETQPAVGGGTVSVNMDATQSTLIYLRECLVASGNAGYDSASAMTSPTTPTAPSPRCFTKEQTAIATVNSRASLHAVLFPQNAPLPPGNLQNALRDQRQQRQQLQQLDRRRRQRLDPQPAPWTAAGGLRARGSHPDFWAITASRPCAAGVAHAPAGRRGTSRQAGHVRRRSHSSASVSAASVQRHLGSVKMAPWRWP